MEDPLSPTTSAATLTTKAATHDGHNSKKHDAQNHDENVARKAIDGVEVLECAKL